jgi:hypothetical protein
MSRFVPYLTEEAIERNAAALLAEYEHARGVTLESPIPIEDIVEKHLKLGIEFDDTHRRFGVPRTAPGQKPRHGSERNYLWRPTLPSRCLSAMCPMPTNSSRVL